MSADDYVEENVSVVQKKARVPGTLQGLTIVIDPGHGGNDGGTTGKEGRRESTLVTRRPNYSLQN